jgi:uncharacterized FAD-dependent dehydrogenase
MTNIAIIGAGLSGLISAYVLSKEPGISVTIFEKGRAYADRITSKGEDTLTGVGGAGTISGGKLCFPPASSGVWKKTGLNAAGFNNFIDGYLNPLIGNISEHRIYPFFNPDNQFDFYNKKYETKLLLKNEMKRFISALLTALQEQNVIINSRVNCIRFEKKENAVKIFYNNYYSDTLADAFDYVIIATGRSSAKNIVQWFSDTEITHTAPDLGIRVSIDNNENEIFSKYGQDIKLKASYGDISVRTFCVCSGGDKTLVKYENQEYYDGHFNDTLSNVVNFGLLVRNKNIIGIDNAVEYCNSFSGFIGDGISLKDIMRYKSVLIKTQPRFGYVFEAINRFIARLIKDGLVTANLDKYQAFMPSIDRLNPIISTNRFFESELENIYVVGDATGISRGFIQSMWSAYYASGNILWKESMMGLKEKMAV